MSYNELVAFDGAVAHWPLDGTVLGIGRDIIGSHNAVANSGITTGGGWLSSAEGAYHFDASAPSWISLGNPADLDTSGAYSLEIWAKPQFVGPSVGTIWQLFPGNTGLSLNDPGTLIETTVGTDGADFWDVVWTNGYGAVDCSLPSVDGLWSHFVWATDGLNYALYRNGVLLTQDRNWGTRPFTPPFPTVVALLGVNWHVESYGAWTGDLAHAAYYPYELSACQVLSHYDEAMTGSHTPCPEWLRLTHSSRRSHIQQNGERIEMRVDDVDVMHLPLPTLTVTPQMLVVKDPASELLGFAPQSTPRTIMVHEQQDIERPNPAGPLTCTQVTCGVATALRDELYSTYGTVRSMINAALGTLGGALGGLLVDTGTAFLIALTDGLDIELAIPIRNALSLVIKAVPGITGSVLQAGFADLNTDQKEWLRQTCWCALLCVDNQVTLTQEMMQDWQTVVAADTTVFSGIQRDALAAIIQYGAGTGLSKWAQVAQTGAGYPLHDCDAYTCP